MPTRRNTEREHLVAAVARNDEAAVGVIENDLNQALLEIGQRESIDEFEFAGRFDPERAQHRSVRLRLVG